MWSEQTLEAFSREAPVVGRPDDKPDFSQAFGYEQIKVAPREVTKGAIYVAGPWRGHANGNKDQFDAVAQMLRNAGWGPVFNPHDLNAENGVHVDQPIEDAIRFDIEAILKSDAICLLPGWRNSEGARTIEVPMAARLKLDFYRAEVQAHADNGAPLWNYIAIDTPNHEVEGIDAEARRGVYGEKAQTYGHPRNDFKCIAGIWGAMIRTKVEFLCEPGTRIEGIPWDQVLEPQLVSTMMTGFKLARQVKSPGHRDTKVDVIGYQLTLERLQEKPEDVSDWERAG